MKSKVVSMRQFYTRFTLMLRHAINVKVWSIWLLNAKKKKITTSSNKEETAIIEFIQGIGYCDDVPAVGTGSEIDLSRSISDTRSFYFFYYIVISIFSLDSLVCFFFIVFHCYLYFVLHLIKDSYIECNTKYK